MCSNRGLLRTDAKSSMASVVPVTGFDVVIVSPITSHGNSDHMT